jgi:hypothetical protein
VLRIDLENEVMENESAIVVSKHYETPCRRLCPTEESQVPNLNGSHFDLKVKLEVLRDLWGRIWKHEMDGTVSGWKYKRFHSETAVLSVSLADGRDDLYWNKVDLGPKEAKRVNHSHSLVP